jgi:RimJ/RimL family protein N-acetyltransferase
VSDTDLTHGGALFPQVVETDRLRLERVTEETPDALTLYDHWREGAPNIDETTEYVTWEPYGHPEGVAETLDRARGRVEKGVAAMFVIRPREGEDGAGEFAGTAGLFAEWERRQGNLGIWLRKPFWGRGYSGERADAMFALAFRRLDLDSVAVAHYPGNENSRRAISKYVERHGGRREGRFRNRVADKTGDIHNIVRYTVTQAEWADASGARTAVTFRD